MASPKRFLLVMWDGGGTVPPELGVARRLIARGHSLAAGVPPLCMPMGRDQNDIAQRVVHRGAGLRLKPTASVAAIRAAVETLLKETRFKVGANTLGQAIRDGDGCVDRATSLESMSRGEARWHQGMV